MKALCSVIKRNPKKEKEEFENGEKMEKKQTKRRLKETKKRENKQKNSTLKQASKIGTNSHFSKSFRTDEDETLRIPLSKLIQDNVNKNELQKSNSLKNCKLTARLKPKVLDPFQKRMKLENQFEDESSILKVPSSQRIQATDD